ncbi:hypothetical protein CCHR01_13690 [Colletotrichum chrysophilum]|uniref:Uncharacterized protein n=1 Tax=Colletotrichum chrysophilum TaxID=1836956 RepID=A0AAD9EGA0_9PEZI|nr:hypothetical protein CCHR01_13690 [Colletotrichum chrysophilum]
MVVVDWWWCCWLAGLDLDRGPSVEDRGSRAKPLGCVRLFQKGWRRVVANRGDWAGIVEWWMNRWARVVRC